MREVARAQFAGVPATLVFFHELGGTHVQQQLRPIIIPPNWLVLNRPQLAGFDRPLPVGRIGKHAAKAQRRQCAPINVQDGCPLNWEFYTRNQPCANGSARRSLLPGGHPMIAPEDYGIGTGKEAMQ